MCVALEYTCSRSLVAGLHCCHDLASFIIMIIGYVSQLRFGFIWLINRLCARACVRAVCVFMCACMCYCVRACVRSFIILGVCV